MLKSATATPESQKQTKKQATSNFMKSIYKKNKDVGSPRVNISSPVSFEEEVLEINILDEILKDRNSETYFQFKFFMEKFGSDSNLLPLYESIEHYRNSNPNFIFSTDEWKKSPKTPDLKTSKKESPLQSPIKSPIKSPVKEDVKSPEKVVKTPEKSPTNPVVSQTPRNRELPQTPIASTPRSLPPTPGRVKKNSIIVRTQPKELPKLPPKKMEEQKMEIENDSKEQKKEVVNSPILMEIKKSVEVIKKESKPIGNDFRSLALQIKEKFFDVDSMYYVERNELHDIKFDEIKFFKVDLFDQLRERIVKILKKEYFMNFMKSPQFIQLLKGNPGFLVSQSTPSSPAPTTIDVVPKRNSFSSSTSTMVLKTPRNFVTPDSKSTKKSPRNNNKSPLVSPPSTKLEFIESKKEEVFQAIMTDGNSPYRPNFKEYLELTSSSQIMNLHESIEFYRISSETDRKIQSMVLTKIMSASPKTKNLLTSEELKQIQDKFGESPVDLFDELDKKITTNLKKFYYNQYYTIQCEKYLYE